MNPDINLFPIRKKVVAAIGLLSKQRIRKKSEPSIIARRTLYVRKFCGLQNPERCLKKEKEKKKRQTRAQIIGFDIKKMIAIPRRAREETQPAYATIPDIVTKDMKTQQRQCQ